MKIWILLLSSSLLAFAGGANGAEKPNSNAGAAAALAGVGVALTLIGYVRRQE
jgi:membrane associated rhomboid family serine protease